MHMSDDARSRACSNHAPCADPSVCRYCDRGSLQDAIDRGWLRQNVAMLNSPPKLADVISTAQEVCACVHVLVHACVHV